MTISVTLVATIVALVQAAAGGAADRVAALADACIPDVTGGQVCLRGGVWEGEPYATGGAARPRVELIRSFAAAGDLDGDGTDELVAFLSESGAGSGSRTHFVVARHAGDTATVLAIAPLGDRIQLRAVAVIAGVVKVDVVQHGRGEPMCCPTRKVTRSWRWTDGRLVEGQPSDEGPVSVGDLADTTWRLVSLGPGQPAPAQPAATASFAAGRVAGSAGCNRYVATVTESAPGTIAVGEMGTTRMACPEAEATLEKRFLSMLGSATHYSFAAGRLVISGPDGTMWFEASDTESQ